MLDGASGRPISGARVRLTAKDGGLAKEAATAANGLYYFLDLPEGTYSLEALPPTRGKRRAPAANQAKVEWDEGNIRTVYVDLTLSPTTIRGAVTSADGQEPIAMAEVRVKAGAGRAFSNLDGQYFLREVETGKRIVQVYAPGYKTASKEIDVVKAGGEYPLDFVLAASTDAAGQATTSRS